VVGVVLKTFGRMIKDHGGNQRHVKDGRRRVVGLGLSVSIRCVTLLVTFVEA
jgi:hypothetical protein